MKLTPGQVREILDIPQETFRHWRKVLPPLAERNGYRPSFTLGDLLALAILKGAIEQLGIRIGALNKVAQPLVDLCARSSWAALERTLVVIEPLQRRVDAVPDTEGFRAASPAVIVPCRPIVGALRQRLLPEREQATQGELMFPPTPVISRERRT
jgi:DNA-binding transcriptional MerR regulator